MLQHNTARNDSQRCLTEEALGGPFIALPPFRPAIHGGFCDPRATIHPQTTQPPLTAANSLPVTELRLTPHHPASGIRVIADTVQNDTVQHSPESLAIENYNPT